jgi:hypothetical protein
MMNDIKIERYGRNKQKFLITYPAPWNPEETVHEGYKKLRGEFLPSRNTDKIRVRVYVDGYWDKNGRLVDGYWKTVEINPSDIKDLVPR